MTEDLKLKIDALQDELLKFPQAECPVKHTFMPGIYMREVTLPAGAAAIGHYQKYDHINIMVKGRVTVLNDDGSTTELVAPMTFIGKPGQKCGYVHEETIWINVHYADNTDVETMEKNLYDLTKAPERIKLLPEIIKNESTEDYKSVIREWGFTEEQVQKEVYCTEDQMPMPFGIYKVKVSDSLIHGKGIFATGDIAEGELIGPANFHGKRTPIGRYTNHSPNPNAIVQKFGEDFYLIALKNIKGCLGGGDGEEITTDYRKNLTLIGRTPCLG